MSEKDDNRQLRRIEVTAYRLNATLAIVVGNRTSGCLVPVKDFSRSGVGVYSKFRVTPQTVVRFSIEDSGAPPLEGKIVWCGPLTGDPHAPPGYSFRLGIEFTPKDDVDRENQIKLFDYAARVISAHERH